MREAWSREDLMAHIDEFNSLYEKRPIKDNRGGMSSSHMFPAWYIVKKMSPRFLIESGVWKGSGTWFFEQASPETKIISIDPSLQTREYISPNVSYQTEDFQASDWSQLIKDETLIFFDDHQDSLRRIVHAINCHFKYMIFEDNYPCQQGDCISPKKILSNADYVIDSCGNRSWHSGSDQYLEYFNSNVDVYQEMPPLFRDHKTRWGDDWNDEDYPTPKALLSESDQDKYPTFYSERLYYTWLCYIELRKQ